MQYEITGEKYVQDVVEGSLQKLSHNADSLLRLLAESIMKNTIAETWKFLKGGFSQMEALSNYLGIGESEEKLRVYYFAVMKTVLELGDLLNQKSEESSEMREYANYKYIDPILRILADSGGITLCSLAERLNISRNSLSNFFKRTDKFGLWRMEQRGKRHYYFITAKGKRVYQSCCIRSIADEENGVERVLLYILDLVGEELEKDSPDPSNIIHMLNQKYDKGISVASSEVFRAKLKEVLIKTERGVYKRKRKSDRIFEMKEERILWLHEYECRNYHEKAVIDSYNMEDMEEVY